MALFVCLSVLWKKFSLRNYIKRNYPLRSCSFGDSVNKSTGALVFKKRRQIYNVLRSVPLKNTIFPNEPIFTLEGPKKRIQTNPIFNHELKIFKAPGSRSVQPSQGVPE